MTVLRYSRGRGRGPPGGASVPSNYSTRGRGGRSGAVRGRSMTWTNSAIQHGRGQPSQNNLPRQEAVPRDQAPKTGVNRVWVNKSARGESGSSSGRGRRNGPPNALVGGISSISSTPSVTSNGSGISREAPLRGGGRTGGSIAVRIHSSKATASTAKMPAPLTRSRSSCISTSKAGNRVWVKSSNGDYKSPTPTAMLNSSANHSSGQKRKPVTTLPCTSPAGALPGRGGAPIQRNCKSGNLVWTKTGMGGMAVASATSSARSLGGDRTSIIRKIATPEGFRASTAKPVSRYSASVNWRLASGSSVAREGYSKRKLHGQIVRYSGLRGGRGKIPLGRGTIAWRGARGGSRGYWTSAPWRGLSGLRGGMMRNYHSRGRGMKPFLHPSAVLRMRYTARLPSALGFSHPASRWAARQSPWAYSGRWGRNPVAASRTRMLSMAKPRFKNRSFIRVRGVILQQPVVNTALRSSSPQTAAAARRFAIARRFDYGTVMSSPKKKAETSTSSGFVHSGRHGMAIRRVGSSHLSTSGAAAASPAKKSETALSVSAGGAHQVGRVKSSTSGNVSLAASKAGKPSLGSSETQQLPVEKAAILSQSRMRTVRSVKASSVVAGARVKKARVLVRNMTLYRGKGEVVVINPAGGARGRAGKKAAEKKAKAKTEPCLFFCKFGKCSKSDDECRYVHDKTKVAVCRGFLRGECKDGDKCLLTHAVQAEKMPVCVYFERGMCFTTNCPYRHVKVSENAAVCPNFLKGYCPDGTACRLKHKYPERKREREADSGDHEGGDGTTDDKVEDLGIETAAGVASAATAASESPFKGKSGESVGLRESKAGVGTSGNHGATASASRGDLSPEAGSGTDAGSVKREWKMIEGDDEHEYEEDELKPRFLWKRRKRS